MTLYSELAQERTLAELLPLLYRTESHFGWSEGIRAFTRTLLSSVSVPEGPVLDAGCGGGVLVAELARSAPNSSYWGIDASGQALAVARALAKKDIAFAQASVMNLPFSDNTFSLCLALDSLDQLGVDMIKSLHECRRVLLPEGVLLLRVSAYSWLYGPHDLAFGTGERHSKADLRTIVQDAGFRIERVTYANTLLAGPAMLLRLLQRWRLAAFSPRLYTRNVLNQLLLVALLLEAKLLRYGDLPTGLSLFFVCRNHENKSGNLV